MKQVYTIETRLWMSTESKTYLNEYIQDYNKMYRVVWNEMISPTFTSTYPTMSKFIQVLCVRFNILKRTANTLRFEVQGRIKALAELKKLELRNLETKKTQVALKIKKAKETINKLIDKIRNNQATEKELTTFRQTKKALFQRQQRLNRLTMSCVKLRTTIKYKKFKVCFGGKNFFNKQYHLEKNNYKTHTKWLNEFRKKRDSSISYLGSKDETAGNQMCQLTYSQATDDFSLKIRKEKAYEMSGKYITFERLDFKYQKELIIHLLDLLNNNSTNTYPLTYRIKRRKNKWYLHVMVTVEVQEDEYLTTKFQGVLGVDYNDGFMEVVETDKCGNLVYQEYISLQYHGTGNKAKSEIEEKLSKLVKQAKQKGKDIVIEDLNFNKTKAKQLKATRTKGKKYNKMLHAFDYSRYKNTLQNIAFRNRVFVRLIPPAYTSRIAKERYTDKMKLNIHQGASYVIARIGQGLKV